RPPTTFTSETTFSWWKFDGTLADSSGNNHTITFSSPSYVATPNQIAVAVAKTLGAPAWSLWTSFRAGQSNRLDSSSSYSLADTSDTVNSSWTQLTTGLSPPSIAEWSSRTSSTPALTGLVFGTYRFFLQVTDVNNSTATATLDVG